MTTKKLYNQPLQKECQMCGAKLKSYEPMAGPGGMQMCTGCWKESKKKIVYTDKPPY